MTEGDGSDDAGVKARHGGELRGLEGAKARGAAAKAAWVRDGLLVSRGTLAQRWGVSLEEVAAMVGRGELFELEVGGQPWVPAVFLELPREEVSEVNRALTDAGADAAKAFVFWHRKHGALTGKAVVPALTADLDVAQVLRLALADYQLGDTTSEQESRREG